MLPTPFKFKLWRGVGHRLIGILLMGIIITPSAAQPPNDPQSIVSAFLDAWNRKDMVAMHTYLSPISQDEFVFEAFNNRYTLANDRLDFSGVKYTIHEVEIQGMSAVVRYDVEIQSTSFGVIPDPGRTMRLVQIQGRWGIAWSSLDIFDVYAAQTNLTAVGQLPRRANIYDRLGRGVAFIGTMVAVYSNKNSMISELDCQILLSQITRRPIQGYINQFIGYAPETDFFLAEFDQETYNRFSGKITTTCGTSYTRENERRVYYNGNAMVHVAGYIGQIQANESPQYDALGYSPDALVGQSGIEKQYQRDLAGAPQRVLRIEDPLGTTLRTLGGVQGSEPLPVTLTIDRDLQVATVQALWDAFDYASGNWGPQADAGAAVVLEVKTGQILAMASYPLFDPQIFAPNSFLRDLRASLISQTVNDPRRPLINHAIQDQYAPGSVYKVITAVAVLNENLIEPTQTFNCDLTWNGIPLGDEYPSRSDWRRTDGLPAAGIITPAQAIMASCNPFFWQYGAILYNERGKKLVEYSRHLGLGQAYNIFGGIIPEAAGNLDDPNRTAVAINNAIGQGDVQITTLQMAVATAAIANDGTVYKPYLVQQVGGVDNTAIKTRFQPTILNQLQLQPDVLATVREGMCGAVSNFDFGTAWAVFNDTREVPLYTACGKTGTAQAGARPNAWFIAFAPADDPQIAVVVTIPRAGREGSEVAAPITRRILDYYFNSSPTSFPKWWNTEPYTPLPIPEDGGGA